MAFNKTPPLDERIAALQAEIDKFIDSMTEEERKRIPGVPALVLRNTMTRGLECQCRAYGIVKAYADERDKEGR